MSAPPNTHSVDPSAHPSHGYPTNAQESTQKASEKSSTASHPSYSKPDPTITSPPSAGHQSSLGNTQDAAQGAITSTSSTSPSELTRLKVKLKNGLRQFNDFPTPGVLFEDIMPLFASPELHNDLIRALELQVASVFNLAVGEKSEVDVIVGLESRGFLFGPTLALRLGAAFVPVRKKGKLPGECETESYQKEYGADHFQMQSDAIKRGLKVIIVDDIIATGTKFQSTV
jgi:adenine phosphoribosyltransferase